MSTRLDGLTWRDLTGQDGWVGQARMERHRWTVQDTDGHAMIECTGQDRMDMTVRDAQAKMDYQWHSRVPVLAYKHTHTLPHTHPAPIGSSPTAPKPVPVPLESHIHVHAPLPASLPAPLTAPAPATESTEAYVFVWV